MKETDYKKLKHDLNAVTKSIKMVLDTIKDELTQDDSRELIGMCKVKLSELDVFHQKLIEDIKRASN